MLLIPFLASCDLYKAIIIWEPPTFTETNDVVMVDLHFRNWPFNFCKPANLRGELPEHQPLNPATNSTNAVAIVFLHE